VIRVGEVRRRLVGWLSSDFRLRRTLFEGALDLPRHVGLVTGMACVISMAGMPTEDQGRHPGLRPIPDRWVLGAAVDALPILLSFMTSG